MTADFQPVAGQLATLDLLQVSRADSVLQVRLNRPAKRNAISDTLVRQLHTCFVNLLRQPARGHACRCPEWRGSAFLRRA